MYALIAIVIGVACGIAAATPIVLQLRREEASLGKGFGSVICAFLIIQMLMLVVLCLWPNLVAHFGVSATLAFLSCVSTVVIHGAFRQPRE